MEYLQEHENLKRGGREKGGSRRGEVSERLDGCDPTPFNMGELIPAANSRC